MTGPEHHPAVPNSAPGDPAAAQPVAPGPGHERYPSAPAHQTYCGPAAPYPGRQPDGSYVTYPGDPGYPGYAPHPGGPYGGYPQAPAGYGGYPQAPVRMPGSVRAAQVLAFVAAGLGLALIVVFGAMAGGEAAGRATAGFGPFLVLGGLAFAFPTGGQGIRTTAIVVGCLTALCGLGSTASQMPPSFLGMLIGGAVAILLAQRSARDWFHRPR
ncbi:hypothetical protein ACFU44_25680 [Nocardia rhizosphaerihabitans]|uniref:hypothetical protein n=1 Tax=Nocardia rhizosphaerihabitans TaxID=1691570 RepID=UPI003671EFA6